MTTGITASVVAMAAPASAEVPCDVPSLVNALQSASGTGNAVIDLNAGCTYTLTAADNTADGGTGLPVISGTVQINGHGATIARSAAAGTAHFRLLDVAATGRLSINSLTLRNGLADAGTTGGGGITSRGTLTVDHTTFDGNSAPSTTGTSGGGIQSSGTLTVTNSLFTGNVGQEGGGIFTQNVATVDSTTFLNNVATIYGGGGLVNAFGTTTVTGSTFIGNSGPGGGAIDNDTTLTVRRSTFYHNTAAGNGGGAIVNFGTLTLTTSTVAANSSPFGADLYNYGTSSMTVSSTIVSDGSTANCGGASPIVDGGYNLDSGTSCGFTGTHGSLAGVSPKLSPPANNGGPTQTMALAPDSPAVDIIPASTAGCTGSTDQRGTSRPIAARCDIGAFELPQTLWALYKNNYSPVIYELVNNTTPTPLTPTRWVNTYGMRAPVATPTDYVVYPWSPSIYAVTFWPGGQNAWQWDHLTSSQWQAAGFPAPRVAGWIKGSSYYQWQTSPELFVLGEDGVLHKLTFAQWAASNFQPFTRRANQGYQKLSWSPEVGFMTSISAGQGSLVTPAQWAAAALPTPQAVARFPGDTFTKAANDPTIFYSGPLMTNRAITYAQWAAAGFPTPTVH